MCCEYGIVWLCGGSLSIEVSASAGVSLGPCNYPGTLYSRQCLKGALPTGQPSSEPSSESIGAPPGEPLLQPTGDPSSCPSGVTKQLR